MWWTVPLWDQVTWSALSPVKGGLPLRPAVDNTSGPCRWVGNPWLSGLNSWGEKVFMFLSLVPSRKGRCLLIRWKEKWGLQQARWSKSLQKCRCLRASAIPIPKCQFLSRWAVGRNVCSILLPLLWPSNWDAIVEPCLEYAGKMGAAAYLWSMVWPPSPLTGLLEKKSWLPSLGYWGRDYVTILTLMELSKFLEATTSPFPGFQGDLGDRSGMKLWLHCLIDV